MCPQNPLQSSDFPGEETEMVPKQHPSGITIKTLRGSGGGEHALGLLPVRASGQNPS